MNNGHSVHCRDRVHLAVRLRGSGNGASAGVRACRVDHRELLGRARWRHGPLARAAFGWLSAALFVLLITIPRTLMNRGKRAADHEEWKKAALLYRWASVLHPSPWTRYNAAFSRALSGDGTGTQTTALTHIEATGSPKQ